MPNAGNCSFNVFIVGEIQLDQIHYLVRQRDPIEILQKKRARLFNEPQSLIG